MQKLLAVITIACAGIVHLMIAPNHFEHAFAHGLFFGVVGVVQIIWAMFFWRWQLKPLFYLGVFLSGGIVFLWGLTELLGLPFSDHAHPIEWPLIVTKLAETCGFCLILWLSEKKAAVKYLGGAVLVACCLWGGGLVLEQILPQSSAHQHDHAHSDHVDTGHDHARSDHADTGHDHNNVDESAHHHSADEQPAHTEEHTHTETELPTHDDAVHHETEHTHTEPHTHDDEAHHQTDLSQPESAAETTHSDPEMSHHSHDNPEHALVHDHHAAITGTHESQITPEHPETEPHTHEAETPQPGDQTIPHIHQTGTPHHAPHSTPHAHAVETPHYHPSSTPQADGHAPDNHQHDNDDQNGHNHSDHDHDDDDDDDGHNHDDDDDDDGHDHDHNTPTPFPTAKPTTPSEPEAYNWHLPAGFPLPQVPDNNPMTTAKVELGRHIFYDTRLSGNETFSCESCHFQELAFTDGVTLAIGSTDEVHPRNSQSLTNVGYYSALTWANPVLDTLEKQHLVPMFGEFPVEMGITGHEDEVLNRFKQDPGYQTMFQAAYPDEADPINWSNLVKALASFNRALISGNSPYDRYIYQKEKSAISDSAKRGMTIFFGEELECHHCHTGFNFTLSTKHEYTTLPTQAFHNTGLYNIGGTGDYPRGNSGLFEITGKPQDMGRFRAPSLRNVALTAPYMHDGSIATLEEVISFYAAGGRVIEDGPHAGDGRVNPYKSGFVSGFTITDEETKDLIAFLNSLTDETFINDPRFSNPFTNSIQVIEHRYTYLPFIMRGGDGG